VRKLLKTFLFVLGILVMLSSIVIPALIQRTVPAGVDFANGLFILIGLIAGGLIIFIGSLLKINNVQ
jgi:cytosine/uracil/thiamine/allantoin permease